MQAAATPRWKDRKVELFLLTPEAVTPEYVAWLNDPLVNRYLESRFAQHDLESTRRFVANALADERALFLGIRGVDLGRHVGNIKIGPIDPHHRVAEVGILLGDRATWGRGLATAAIERVVDIARAELHLRKLSAGCYASNAGSARAFEKAGFAVEGRRPAHFLVDGRPEDGVLLGRLL